MYFAPRPHPSPCWFEMGATWSQSRQELLSWKKRGRVSRRPTQSKPYIIVLPVPQMSRKELRYCEEWKGATYGVTPEPSAPFEWAGWTLRSGVGCRPNHASRRELTPGAKTHEQGNSPGQRGNSWKQTSCPGCWALGTDPL